MSFNRADYARVWMIGLALSLRRDKELKSNGKMLMSMCEEVLGHITAFDAKTIIEGGHER